MNGVAEADLRVLIVDRCKVKLLCKAHDFRVLRHNYHTFKLLGRDRFQAAQNQAPSAQGGGQFICSEPSGISGGHDHASQ